MPRNVAQSTNSWATSISTEESITPCGGNAIPTAANNIAATNAATDRYLFILILIKTKTKINPASRLCSIELSCRHASLIIKQACYPWCLPSANCVPKPLAAINKLVSLAINQLRTENPLRGLAHGEPYADVGIRMAVPGWLFISDGGARFIARMKAVTQ